MFVFYLDGTNISFGFKNEKKNRYLTLKTAKGERTTRYQEYIKCKITNIFV